METNQLDNNQEEEAEAIFYHRDRLCEKELGSSPAFLLSIIDHNINRLGYCCMKNTELAQKINLCPSYIPKILNKLEEKRWIFRETYKTPPGHVRHIITTSSGSTYIGKFLSQDGISLQKKKDFMHRAFPGWDQCISLEDNQ